MGSILFLQALAWSQTQETSADVIARGQELKESFLELQKKDYTGNGEQENLRIDSVTEGEEMKGNWVSLWSFFSLLTLSTTQIPEAHAQSKRLQNGGRGPGGGDVLLCEKSNSNRFNGIYSYDYVQTRDSLKNENEDEFNFPTGANCLERMNKIATRLSAQNPIMGAGLKDFIKSVPFKGGESSTAKRRWIASGVESAPECHSFDLKDETHLVQTKNCQTCQLFIRDYSRTRAQVLYTYNSGLFKELQTRPEQCSYALIHEWARDFLPDSKDLYFFTASLHSDEFMKGGDLNLLPLDEQTERCFKNATHSPLDANAVDIYFNISALVPPTQDEVERYQDEMVRMSAEIDKDIEERILKLKETPPIGYSEKQVDYLIAKVQREKTAILAGLDAKEISHAEAYNELKRVQSSIPSYRPAEFDIGMMLFMEPMGATKFVPMNDPGPIKMIEIRPKR